MMMKKYKLRFVVSLAVICLCSVPALLAQTIQGTVTDAATGESLPGVNIVIKGAETIGTSSNQDGTFELDVPSLNSVLVVSYIGYQTLEVPIQGRQTVIIELTASILEADELMVVAYGVQRRSDITGAIASAQAEDFNKGVVVNPGQMLQGVVSGVNVTSSSGEPGASQDIIIRGVGSLRSGTQPLFVVDGFMLDNSGTGVANNPLNFINPNDIESMEVLKDASAAALYGARAANGVVVITTKRGRAGATTMNFTSSASISTLANRVDVFSADEFRRRVPASGGTLEDFGASTDWQDELSQRAFSSDVNLSLGGGAGSNLSYYASLGVQNQEGILRNSNLQRYSGRLNLNQTALNDRLRVNYTINAVHTENLRPSTGSIINDMLQLNPTIPLYTNGELTRLEERLHPLQRNEIYSDYADNNRILANVAPSLEILENLQYRLNLGIDYSVTDRYVQNMPYNLLEGWERGSLTTYDAQNTNSLVENTLTYIVDKEAHSVNLLAGHSFQRFYIERTNVSKQGFVNNGIEPRYQDQISTNITPTETTAWAQEDKLLSFFGRLNYSYDNKYLMTATFRADGSSKFGSNNRFGYFPSFALGWNISQEEFFTAEWADVLKLRGSWGQTGNQEIPSKITQLSYSENRSGSSTYPLSPGITSLDQYPFGTIFSRLANPDIQWEVSTQFNMGLDFELFNSQLVGTFDYYTKVSDNILLEIVPSDPIQPTSTYWTNIPNMEIRNSGIELSLEYRNFVSSDFQYSIGGNITTIDNKVHNSPFAVLTTGAALGAGQTGATINGYINKEPIGAFFMLEHDGIGQDGLNLFVDQNGDGEILENDRIIAGSALPNLLYGMKLQFNYRRLGLGLNFNGAAGHKIYNHTAMSLFQRGLITENYNTTEFALEFPNEAPTNSNTVSTRYLETGDYLRLNNATLSYTLAPELVGLEGVIRGLDITLTGQNLFTLTSYSGFDPEMNTGTTQAGIQTFGIDYFTYPTARTLSLGINLTF